MYLVIFNETDDGFHARVEDLPGCVAVGDTLDEARFNIQEALYLHLNDLRNRGEEVPDATSHVEELEPIEPLHEVEAPYMA